MKSRSYRNLIMGAGGLVLGPAAWALNTQLGQLLPYADCATGWRFSAFGSLGCLLLCLAGLAMSGRTAVAETGNLVSQPATSRFVALLGTLNGIVFSFALLLQGVASLVLSGCER